MRWQHVMGGAGALGAIVALTSIAHAQPSYINGVPDWDQAHLVGGGAPGGAMGSWGAWCLPSAMSNIVGFYDDAGVMGIGDGMVYPNSPMWSTAGFQDDQAAPTMPRTDLGWHLDTNGLGVGGGAGHTGTRLVDVFDGLVGINGYFPSHSITGASVTNYGADVMPGGVFMGFDNTGDMQSAHTMSAGFSFIVNEINAGRPLLGHFAHFNHTGPVNSPDMGGFFPGDSFDDADWADAPMFPAMDSASGEVWDPSAGLGHTVTIVGYWLANDISNPNFGTDSIIVHDNVDGDLGGVAKPLVLPWATSSNPWQGLTAIDNVPAPGSVVLLFLGGGTQALSRRRRRV